MRDFWTGKRRYNKSVWYYDLYTYSNSSVSISCVLVAQAIKIQPDIGIDSMLSGLHNSNFSHYYTITQMMVLKYTRYGGNSGDL